MKAIRVAVDERGALALEMTPEAQRYARETEREARREMRARDAQERARFFRRDRSMARFLALIGRREGGAL